MSALRREAIRVLLQRAGEDPHLAEPAFEVFFEARQKVSFFEDAMPALNFLKTKYPMVALSNGNADILKVGLGDYFVAAFNPINLGVGKPDPKMFHAGAKALGVLPRKFCTSAMIPIWMFWLHSVQAFNRYGSIESENSGPTRPTLNPTLSGVCENCAKLGPYKKSIDRGDKYEFENLWHRCFTRQSTHLGGP
jgi:hypothetical protein